MPTILEKILAVKKVEVALAKKTVPLEALSAVLDTLPRCRNFYRTLTKKNPRGINVIAEIKRTSPSTGLIREDFDPVSIARIYEEAGADAISVVTDETFFQGKLDFIGPIKEAVALPVLRKDFIIDPYQVYQSRVAGADAILLIAEVINPSELMDMMILANSLTMTVLLEVHEIESLLQMRSMLGFPQEHYSLLGINNRNLKSMEVDLSHSVRLIEFVEGARGVISESGIKNRQDVERLKQAGFDGILIGETLMVHADITAAFSELFD